MTAESMVEKVARVLEPAAWAALNARDSLAYKNRRTSSLRKARAAIEAMREPVHLIPDPNAVCPSAATWVRADITADEFAALSEPSP